MKKKTVLITFLPFLLMGLLPWTTSVNLSHAQENLQGNSALPPIKMFGQTEFISGGIGNDESGAILRTGKEWPLTLELAQNAQPRAEYISDVHVKITDTKGNVVLDAESAGPYLLVKLPPGNYVLDAVYNSVALHRKLNLEAGSGKKISLIWPETK